MSSTSSTKDRAPARAGRGFVATGPACTPRRRLFGLVPEIERLEAGEGLRLAVFEQREVVGRESPRTGWPFPSTTTASTVTSSTLRREGRDVALRLRACDRGGQESREQGHESRSA